MSNQVIDLQLSIPSGVKNPIITGSRKLTLINLAKLLWGGLNAGKAYGLGGAGAFLQAQTSIVAASGTVTPAAAAVNDTVSINGQALTAKQLRASGTVTAASVLEGDTFTINGQVFTAVNGAVTLGDATFDCSGTNTQCATSIAAQVNAYGGSLVAGIVAAKSASAVVTLYCLQRGTWGNSVALASSDGGRLAVSGATLANGAATANNQFDCIGTDVQTAADIARAVADSTTTAVQACTAAAAAGVCTFTSKVGGIAGNGIALTSSSNTTLPVSGSGTLSGGSASAVTRWAL